MSTPASFRALSSNAGRYMVSNQVAPRVYSGLINDYLPAKNRSNVFRCRGLPTVIVKPRVPVELRLGHKPALEVAYIGARVPFEAIWSPNQGLLRVETHLLPGMVLVLDLVLNGTVSIDCSAGGTFVAPAGSYLVGWSQKKSTHAVLIRLPLSRQEASHLASLALPMHSIATVQISPHVQTLMYVVWTGGVKCMHCGLHGSLADLAKHYRVARFMTLPHEVIWVPAAPLTLGAQPSISGITQQNDTGAGPNNKEVFNNPEPTHLHCIRLPVVHVPPLVQRLLSVPFSTLGVCTIQSGSEALVHLPWSGGVRCIACEFTGTIVQLARHMGLSGFKGPPRPVGWVAERADSGRAYAGREFDIRPRNLAISRWKSDFLAESATAGAVAWHHLPQVNAADLTRRLRALLPRLITPQVFTMLK